MFTNGSTAIDGSRSSSIGASTIFSGGRPRRIVPRRRIARPSGPRCRPRARRLNRYPRPGIVAIASCPRILRSAETCTCRLFSSTTSLGQTLSSSVLLGHQLAGPLHERDEQIEGARAECHRLTTAPAIGARRAATRRSRTGSWSCAWVQSWFCATHGAAAALGRLAPRVA